MTGTPTRCCPDIELLPCPFCGPGQSMVDPWFDDVSKRWAIGCGRCGASSGRSVHAEGSKEAAIKSWNTRGVAQSPSGSKAKSAAPCLNCGDPSDELFCGTCREMGCSISTAEPTQADQDSALSEELRKLADEANLAADRMIDAADRILEISDGAHSHSSKGSPAKAAWQPIETAPKDGTRIDVWFQLTADHGGRWANVSWSHEHQVWSGGPPSQYKDGWTAAHWMPIPDGPMVSSTGRNSND